MNRPYLLALAFLVMACSDSTGPSPPAQYSSLPAGLYVTDTTHTYWLTDSIAVTISARIDIGTDRWCHVEWHLQDVEGNTALNVVSDQCYVTDWNTGKLYMDVREMRTDGEGNWVRGYYWYVLFFQPVDEEGRLHAMMPLYEFQYRPVVLSLVRSTAY